jgi:thiol-disulfide isomerase/thioredoxin
VAAPAVRHEPQSSPKADRLAKSGKLINSTKSEERFKVSEPEWAKKERKLKELAVAAGGTTAVKASPPVNRAGYKKPVRPAPKGPLPNPLADRYRLERLATQQVRHFKFSDKPRPPVDLEFVDDKGNLRSLIEWHGKSFLLNFWAPWCDACKRELPSMEKLKKRLGRQDFEVIIVNIEEDMQKGSAFLQKIGVKNIISLRDQNKQGLTALTAIGIPTSILFDCHGRELGRLKGSAIWNTDSPIVLIKAMMLGSGCFDKERDKL